eukprot:gnl/Chilomastix_caulleri/5082.p2 GENE.gnl/Chilomastix_caulleri/5082~~gnl/Chilomastix_caulleri/5082.p2  ORF type:complete len:96 (+),score=24.80 gnl/Chilomastix_caulleri/5082:116-403(+)
MWPTSMAALGGRNTGASNTFFANGLVDPWHVLGVLATSNPGCSVVVMPPTSHCYDLYVTDPTDPAIVDEVKAQERLAVLGVVGSVMCVCEMRWWV